MKRTSKLLTIAALTLMTSGLTGCLAEPDDAEVEESLSQMRQELVLMQNDNGECAYAGTVTCSHDILGTSTHSHTEYVMASEFVGGQCPATLDVGWELNGWSCQGMIAPVDPIELTEKEVVREVRSFEL